MLGSARYLQHLGFKAIASTSCRLCLHAGRVGWRGAARHDARALHELAQATDLPLNADFEAGHADDLAGVAESVRLCIETGVAGLSIEDRRQPKALPLDDAVARMRLRGRDRQGRRRRAAGRPRRMLLLGRPDLDETIARLKAYANAGADCLYAPGIKTREQIAAVVKAVGRSR